MPAHTEVLTPYQQRILSFLYTSLSMSDIAFTLKVKPFTIQNAAKRVYSKMGVTNRTELFAQRIATLEAEVTAAQRGWSNLSTLRTSPAIREVYPASLLYKVPQRLWGNYVVECDMCNNEVDPRIPICKWCRVSFCSEACKLRHMKVYEQVPSSEAREWSKYV